MAKIAVVMAGCGYLDGSEVHESTLSLLYLAKGGASYDCFAPNEVQVQVVDHVTNDLANESRNQMLEAARIARGAIRPITEAEPDLYDALVIPGGSGAFLNLGKGPGEVHPQLKRLLESFADAGKPIAAICIAPLLVARALGNRGIRLTIGEDPGTAAKIEATGAKHIECRVEDCVVDEPNKIVSTPAYMLGPGIGDVAQGIEAAIKQLLAWCG